MGQTDFLAAILLFLFFIYITTKGELPKYLKVIGF